jgi:hypothetical protein
MQTVCNTSFWLYNLLPVAPIADEQKIIDQTETNLVAFRRTVYLTIQSSLDFEECAHKLLKMDIKAGYEEELGNMILDCCAQQRTYEKFFGLLAQVRRKEAVENNLFGWATLSKLLEKNLDS